MVSATTVVAVAFLLAVVVFAVGITWASLRGDRHTPKALQPDGDDDDA